LSREQQCVLHANLLAPCAQSRKIAAPKVIPEPKAVIASTEPGPIRPVRRASSMAIGIVAAEVFP
jgi:hypothetical protein